MLTGDLSITKGTAYLDGFNIQTHLRQVSGLNSTLYLIIISLIEKNCFCCLCSLLKRLKERLAHVTPGSANNS